MLTLSPQSHDALARDYSPRAAEALKTELLKADWALFGTLPPERFDWVVQEALRQGAAVGMNTVGAAAIFATLITASRGQPDMVEEFVSVLAILRDTNLPEDLRRHRAAAMLSDPAEDMPASPRGNVR